MNIKPGCALLAHLTHLQDVVYTKPVQDGVYHLDAGQDKDRRQVWLQVMVDAAQSEIWRAGVEMLTGFLKQLEPHLKGVFQFELLSMDCTPESTQFQSGIFMKSFLELACRTPVGQRAYFDAGSCMGIITKLADEDRGRTLFSSHVTKFDRPMEQLNLAFRRLTRAAEALDVPLDIVWHDVSPNPIYNVQNQAQAEALKIFKGQVSAKWPQVHSITILDAKGPHEVFFQTQLDLGF